MCQGRPIFFNLSDKRVSSQRAILIIVTRVTVYQLSNHAS